MFENSIFLQKISSFERYGLFLINILTYFAYGILSCSFGAALQTIQRIFGLTFNQVSSGLSFQAFGGATSACLALFALDKWNRQKFFSINTLILGLLVCLFPFLTVYSFSVFLAINLLIGFFSTLIDCITNAWVVELFRPKEHLFLQTLHFMYSLGTVMSPVILGPYLDKKNKTLTDEINEIDKSNFTGNLFIDHSDIELGKELKLSSAFEFISNQISKSDIWIPFIIFGILMIVCSIIQYVAYHIKPYQEIEKKKPKDRSFSISNYDFNNNSNLDKSSNNLINGQEGHLNKAENLSNCYYYTFVSMIVILVAFEVTNEVNGTNFLATFLEKSNLNLDQENAGYVLASFQFVIAFVRFINIFLSIKVNTVLNIYFNFISMTIGSVILLIFSQSSLPATKVGVVLLGLGFSSTYPLIFSFVEQRITLTNKISSVMAFASVLGLICSPFIFGPFLEKNPEFFVYVTFAFTITSLFCFTILFGLEILRSRKKLT